VGLLGRVVSIEHEAKFPLDDRAALEARLRQAGRLRTPWHFESNTVYDRDGELGRTRRLLRLRRAMGATLTFKEPAPGPAQGGVKSRLERECRVDRPESMDAILRGLGFAPRLKYEKFRSVWDFEGASLFLDIVPFGHFLEIEAAPEAIPALARSLGLDPAAAIGASYHALHRAWRAARGLGPAEDFTFEPAERQRLAKLLGCEARISGDHQC
jgi:adenylate cyclase class 2